MVTAKVLEQFKGFVKRSYNQFINDTINERLKSALNNQQQQEVREEISEPTEPDEQKIVTTEEEMEGFYIIKSILRPKMEGHRVFFRDTQSYFGILIDNNNRKPVCRLHFNGKKKYLSLFDKDNEEKIEIKNLDDLYTYEQQIQAAALKYKQQTEEAKATL